MSGQANKVTKTFGAVNIGANAVKAGSTTAVPVSASPAPVAYAVTATVTAADALTGMITSSTAAAVTATMPTATLLLAALTRPAIGDTFTIVFINTGGSNAITVAAGSGGSLVGLATVASATSGTYRVRVTAITTPTYIMYRI